MVDRRTILGIVAHNTTSLMTLSKRVIILLRIKITHGTFSDACDQSGILLILMNSEIEQQKLISTASPRRDIEKWIEAFVSRDDSVSRHSL
jgi:hypothetical protein